MAKRLILDTHAWYWALFEPDRLTPKAAAMIEMADDVIVSAVSAYEIGQKLRRNRWPGMDYRRLNKMLVFDGIEIWSLNERTAAIASLMDWPHRDPFDRVIAAVALGADLPLVSEDKAFDQIRNLQRIWSS